MITQLTLNELQRAIDELLTHGLDAEYVVSDPRIDIHETSINEDGLKVIEETCNAYNLEVKNISQNGEFLTITLR